MAIWNKVSVMRAPDDLGGGGAAVVVDGGEAAPAVRPRIEDPDDVLGRTPEPPRARIVEAAEDEGPSRDDLAKLYADAQAENARLKAQNDPMAAFTKGLGELKEGIGQIAGRPVVVQAPAAQPAGPSYDEVLRETDEKFLESPSSHVLKLAGMAIEGPMKTLVDASFNTARRFVAGQGTDKEMFARYSKEIDEEFAALDMKSRVTDPIAAYERAFATVKGRHIDEIVAARSAPAAVIPAAVPGSAGNAPAAPAAPAAATRAGQGSPMATPAGANEERVIRLKPGQKTRILAHMERNGIDVREFETFVEILDENGQLAAF